MFICVLHFLRPSPSTYESYRGSSRDRLAPVTGLSSARGPSPSHYGVSSAPSRDRTPERSSKATHRRPSPSAYEDRQYVAPVRLSVDSRRESVTSRREPPAVTSELRYTERVDALQPRLPPRPPMASRYTAPSPAPSQNTTPRTDMGDIDARLAALQTFLKNSVVDASATV